MSKIFFFFLFFFYIFFRFPAPFDGNNSPTYELKYLLSCYACLASFGGYLGVDGLFVGFCLHLSGHYKIIRDRVAELNKIFLEEEASEDLSSAQQLSYRDDNMIKAKIISIVESHVEIINLTKVVGKIFNMIVFVHFFAAAIVIGMTSINFLLVRRRAEENSLFIFYWLIFYNSRPIGPLNCCTQTTCLGPSCMRICMLPQETTYRRL